MALVIDNAVIDRMISQPAIFGMIPCLRNPTLKPQDCGQCGGASRVDYNAVKICLAGLGSQHLLRLKQALGANELHIFRPTTHRDKRVAVLHRV
jgi:hypothetical protein